METPASASPSSQPSDREDGEDLPPVTRSEEEDGRESAQQAARPSKPLCNFYSRGHFCHFGKRCRFLHQTSAPSETPRGHEIKSDPRPGCKVKDPINSPVPQHRSDQCGVSEKKELSLSSNPRTTPAKWVRAQRTCHYFLSGFCAKEDSCRFWHPKQFPSVDDKPAAPRDGARPRVSRPPAGQEPVRLADLTEEMTQKLRDTEISQLMKRFQKDKLKVQESEDSRLTSYRLTVEATDPDWPYDLKEMEVMISFPDNYPHEVFTVDVPEDQHLPSVMGKHVQLASQEWLQAKHSTSQLLGKVELLFRPYLHWLDRSMERLFTEGARQLKKDIDLERSGIQFVPYEQLQTAEGRTRGPEGALTEESLEIECKARKEDESSGEAESEQAKLSIDEESSSQTVENIKTSEPRKGTEVKLLGLRLGEGTATVVAREITVSLQCSRCKVTSDLTLSCGLTCTAHCEKCGAEIRAAFRPSILHHYSSVLGYLDLCAVVALDLVLQDCQLIIGCLSCSKEDIIQSLPYGQNKEINCQHCHSKLSIFVEATGFQFIQPRSRKTTGQESSLQTSRSQRNPLIQRGKPLPEKGTCKHYRQSHRWLRFPCCGRAYPCDACHDEDQDHLMELATRMICGYCAKEQPYSNDKPCVSCGGMMTRRSGTSHWEGGLGCRSKAKMSRNDRHKYTNMCKTVSRKANSEK